ncbi:SNF2-related protein [Actinomyces sp. W5033]|uniref:DEAD/DEAH box helicase n=1 Tax=Actinomyces sp. W5033 TaxID=3446479 RepID=UPI003EE0F319
MAREITEEDWPARVSDEQVITWAGAQVFLRGRRYADEGRVMSVSVSAGGDILMAQVRGSARTYQTMLHATGRGGRPTWGGSCSCPVRTSCKHTVALLLAARAQALAQVTAGSWQAQLDELLHVSERPCRSLALEVCEDPRGWSHGLTLLPLIEGRQGWNKRGAAWSAVLGGGLRHEVAPEVLEPVQEIGRMCPSGFYYDDDRVSLDDVPPRVWDALRRAVAAGLALTTAQRGGLPVVIQPGLRVGLGIERQEDGCLVILPEIDTSRVEGLGQALVADGCAPEPVGQPVHAFAATTPDRLILMPVEPAPDEVLARVLADRGRRVVVPEADVPRFEAEHLERLMRAVPVIRVGEGVAVPEPTVVTAVLRVTVDGATHRSRTDWLMRYLTPGGELRREVLLGDLSAEGDHAVAGGRERPARQGTVNGKAEEPARAPAREVSRPVPRDLPAERRAARQALSVLIPLAAEHGVLWHSRRMSGIDTARFMVRSLPVLQGLDDLETEVLGEVPNYRAAEGELVISTQVSEEEDRPDWFSLRVRVHVGEDQVPIERLIAAVANGDKEVLLDSGAWVEVDRPEVQRLAALMEQGRELAEPRAAEPGTMRITPYQAGYYAQLVEMGVVGETARRWRQSVEGLLAVAQEQAGATGRPGGASSTSHSVQALDAPVPAGLRASLRPYQLEGYRWLHLLRRTGLGGVLADDMGLGKTVQILAEVQHMVEEAEGCRPPVLVVAPTSVVGAWVEQARRFCPDLDVRAVTRTRAARGTTLEQEADGADLVVTSYTIVRLDEEAWAAAAWSWVVLDEAQFIKNHASATYRAVRRLRSPCALAVTGTPLENSLMDLWSLLSVSAPGLLPGPERFNELYRRRIERGGEAGARRLAELRRRVGPFMLRRTKEQVAVDLPVKTEQVMSVELSPAHRRAYELRLIRERQKVMGLLEDDSAQARFCALRSLTILRQMALDPGLVEPHGQDADGEDAGACGRGRRPAAKAELLLQTLKPVIAEGHKALVFSQFTRYLRGVQEVLDRAGLRVLYLDGSTPDRDGVISRFREGEGDVFLVSLKAGGFGLTLTEADYVFLLDPWWNPQVEAQAVDRAHRIGQDRPVLVYRLVCAGTIEEKVMALKEKKADLFSRVIEGGEAPARAALTAEEIRALLED